MALLKAFTAERPDVRGNTEYPDAYHRVERITIMPQIETVYVELTVYADAAAAEVSGTPPVHMAGFTTTSEEYAAIFAESKLTKSGVETVGQAYALVKGRAEYDGARDA